MSMFIDRPMRGRRKVEKGRGCRCWCGFTVVGLCLGVIVIRCMMEFRWFGIRKMLFWWRSSESPHSQIQMAIELVLILVSYRVALLGFPLTPATPAAETNPGILDQRLGLEWVRDNIASFGGDPSRMTLFGESAGSTSVDIHAYAYAKDPIVQAYIMQSGQVQLYSGDNVDGDGVAWRQVTDRVGCTDLGDRKKELRCMQAVDAEVLQKVLEDDLAWITAPHTDGVVVFGAKEYERRAKLGLFSKLVGLPLPLQDLC